MSAYPRRALLEGVPPVGYNLNGREVPSLGCLCSILEYLGDPQDYDYLMGVSGAAFRRLWERDDGGSISLHYFESEPIRRTFEAIGRGYRSVGLRDRAGMAAAIQESIARGTPAILFGPIGPPEPSIVTGYSDGGEVLHGHSYFREWRPECFPDPERPSYFEKPGWLDGMDPGCPIGVLTLGERRPTLPRRQVLAASLEWAVKLGRSPRLLDVVGQTGQNDRHACGLAAYDAWAEGLETDADYPAEDEQTLFTRLIVHGDQCQMLAERRSAAAYLRLMSDAAPEATASLEASASLYDAQADLHPDLRAWDAEALKCPQTRRDLAATVRRARDLEAEALSHLEAALAALAA